jgi:DNA invertase Pin-like site-specific DNA recombinase
MTALAAPTAVLTTTLRPSVVGRIRSQAGALGLGQVRVLKGGGRRRGAAEALLKDLLSGGVATVVVESIERLHPVPAKALALLSSIRAAGLRVVCLSDGWADSADVTTLQAVATYLAAVEQRAASRRGRTAVASARASGRSLGRPRKPVDLSRARALIEQFGSIRRAAREMNLGASTLRRAFKRAA